MAKDGRSRYSSFLFTSYKFEAFSFYYILYFYSENNRMWHYLFSENVTLFIFHEIRRIRTWRNILIQLEEIYRTRKLKLN